MDGMALVSTVGSHEAARADTVAAPPGYARFVWSVLGVNLFVILWGAFVRATGSGAGCGSHWPLCNGEVVPRSPAVETLIELGHRLTSGVALLLVAALIVGAWRRFPPGHAVRRAAAWSGFFILTEALIGAGLVLLELVAENASLARGYWVAGHLVNTFLLVAALALTAWFASGGRARRPTSASSLAIYAAAVSGVILLGISGAVTALGDTLFPAATLAEAKALTFSESAHVFVRLRIWHPTIAVAVGVVLAIAAQRARVELGTASERLLAHALVSLYAIQLAIGVANVWLLAPIPLQMLHLLLSHLIWIALLLMIAATLGSPSRAWPCSEAE
jgi:heme A synthase